MKAPGREEEIVAGVIQEAINTHVEIVETAISSGFGLFK